MAQTVNLTGLTLPSTDASDRPEIEGNFTKESLTELFIEQWVPYYECHKCGRFDYCKHVVRLRGNPRLAQDIKCGIFREALEVFVEATFHLIVHMGKAELQQYLETAFHYGQFIFIAELWIGDRRSKRFSKAMGKNAPIILGNLFFLRERLESLATAMSKMKLFDSLDAVLFVEGHSEKAFLDKLAESGMSWFCYLSPQVYAGCGNCSPKRIEMLLQKYIDRGYKIFMQADADGKEKNPLDPLINRGLVIEQRTFVFKHDFETSIPPRLAYDVLRHLGFLNRVSRERYIRNMTAEAANFSTLLSRHFHIDAGPLKRSFATSLGALLNASGAWWEDKDFMATELGQFLTFIQWVH